MSRDPPGDEAAPYVSTGALPAAQRVQDLVSEAYERFRANSDGHNSTVYPALARAPHDLFGICIARTNGETYAAGDADAEFTIMSVAKPFVLALVCQVIGPDEVRRRLGVNATGLPFNSLAAVEGSGRRRDQPDGEPGRDRDHQSGSRRLTGRAVALSPRRAVALRRACRWRWTRRCTRRRPRPTTATGAWPGCCRAIDRIYGDPTAVVDLYTRQSCLSVSARDLAVMGATLADGGVNPVTGNGWSTPTAAATRWP